MNSDMAPPTPDPLADDGVLPAGPAPTFIESVGALVATDEGGNVTLVGVAVEIDRETFMDLSNGDD